MNMFKPTGAKSIEEYIDSIEEPRKGEIVKLDKFIREVAPTLEPYFAYNMLGYGSFHYKSKSGREGDWPLLALASQKNYISVYLCAVKDGKYIAESYGKKFGRRPEGSGPSGKVSVGKSCIRFKSLSDIKLDVLKEAILEGVKHPGF